MSEDGERDFRQYPLSQPGVRVVLLPPGDTATGGVRVAKTTGTDDPSGPTGDIPATAGDVPESGHPERVTASSGTEYSLPSADPGLGGG